MFGSIRAARQSGKERPALQSVLPYFAMRFSGWMLYATLNVILLVAMAAGAITVNQPWDDFAANLFMGLVLLPVAFAFSVRLLPLYLRLPETAFRLFAFGQCGKSIVIFLFVVKLDVLLRRRLPWTVHRIGEPGLERRPTRPGLPDYGEFGRFERLLYAAYSWLLLGAGLECLTGIAPFSQGMFALSGIAGLAAVACLAVNLQRPAKA